MAHRKRDSVTLSPDELGPPRARQGLHELRRIRSEQRAQQPAVDHCAGLYADPPRGPKPSLYGPYTGPAAAAFEETIRESAATAPKDWAQEWFRVVLATRRTLSLSASRLRRMAVVAKEFAAAASQAAAKVVEDRCTALSQRTALPVAGDAVTYLHRGIVHVIATEETFASFFGSREAAHRAALNELRAVRTLAGAAHLYVLPPLCSVTVHYGVTVFSSAPLPLFDATLGHGVSPAGVPMVGVSSVYEAVGMGELLCSQPHKLRPSGESRLASPISDVPIADAPTAVDSRRGSTAEGMRERRMSTVDVAVDPATLMLQMAFDVRHWHCTDVPDPVATDVARWIAPAVVPNRDLSRKAPRDDHAAPEARVCRHPLEDEEAAALSVRFRPEFLHSRCGVLLNGDAGTPAHSAPQDQEEVAAALHTLYGLFPALRHDLIARADAAAPDPLPPATLSTVLHKHGVNVRYLGRILCDIRAQPAHVFKHATTKAGLIFTLEVEVAARTWKSVLHDKLAQEDFRLASCDATIISYAKALLLCAGDSERFWELLMKPRMATKFGCAADPVRHAERRASATKGAHGTKDLASLQVYRAVAGPQVRVESVDTPYTWAESEVPTRQSLVGGGALPGDGVGGWGGLFPLLGPHARLNAVLLRRALDLAGVDMASDMRGKRIFVHFKPRSRPCTPLFVCAPAAVLAAHAPPTAHDAMATEEDPVELAQAVGAACEHTLAAFRKLSNDSDPRALPALYYAAHCAIGRPGMTAAQREVGALAVSSWFEARRVARLDIVAGMATLEGAVLFARLRLPHRAVPTLQTALDLLRIATAGKLEHEVVAAGILRGVTALLECSAALGGAGVDATGMPGLAAGLESYRRPLEYLDLVCAVLEDLGHPLFGRALAQAAELLWAFYTAAPCSACGQTGVVAAVTDNDGDDGVDHGYTEISDARPPRSAIAAPSVASGAGLSTLPRPQPKASTQRRRRGDGPERRPEPEEAAVEVPPLPDLGVLVARRGSSPAEVDLPRPAAANGAASPALATRPGRLVCRGCLDPRAEHVLVAAECGALFGQAAQLLQRVHDRGRSAETDATLGGCLVALGELRQDPALVQAGIAHRVRVYGAFSRPVLSAELDLAKLLHRKFRAAGQSALVAQRDVSLLGQAEEVLKTSLAALLRHGLRPGTAPGDGPWDTEIADAVHTLHAVVDTYTEFPAAKREHQGVHYVVDTLLPALGPDHPLVGQSLHRLVQYYVRLAKPSGREINPVAGSTALQTAGKYAVQWLECLAVGPDAAAMLRCLTLTRDHVVRVLQRMGNAPDRAAASAIAADVRRVVEHSRYKAHGQCVSALAALAEVFQKQSRVVEEAAKAEAFLAELKGLRSKLTSNVARIERHTDRSDAYGRGQLSQIQQARQRTRHIAAQCKDPAVQSAAATLLLLQDEALHSPTEPDDAALPGGGGAGHVAYESPYAFLSAPTEQAEAPEAALRPFSSTSSRRMSRHGRRAPHSRDDEPVTTAAALPALSATETAGRDRDTAAQLRRVFPVVALAASRKTFAQL